MAKYELFLGGYSTLKNDHVTFSYARWLKKKIQFCEIFLFRIAWKITSCECKNFFAIYGSFCEIDMFPLGIFSIHTFNLRNLKGNGNIVNDFAGSVYPQRYLTKLTSDRLLRPHNGLMIYNQIERALVITKWKFKYCNSNFLLVMTSKVEKVGQKHIYTQVTTNCNV